jgi:ABC-type transport system substrate-binding protein
MLTKQRVGIITVLLVILLITTFSPIIGCSKKDIIPPSTTNLNEIHYLPVPINDDSQETNMLVNGQSNMIPSITSLSEVEKLKTSKEINIYFSEKGGFTISCVFFNMRRRPFDEQAFREAIARIINRDYVVDFLFYLCAAPFG